MVPSTSVDGSARVLDFIQDIPGVVWEVSLLANGVVDRFTYLSENAERILGYPRSYLLQRSSWSEMVHPEDVESFWKEQRDLFTHGDRGTMQHRIVTKDGRTIPIEATITVVRDEYGVPIAMRGITLDISERYRSNQRWKYLAEASELLAESVDLESTLEQTTHLLVPDIADLCSVHLMQTNGKIARIAVAGSTPELETMSRESSERFPPKPESTAMILTVLQSKQSWMSDISDDLRREHAISEEHLQFMREMDIRSVIITPLYVHGEMLGVITLSRQSARPSFTEEDRLFVEQLAKLAGLAIYKSRALANANAETDRRKQIQERMEFLLQSSALLAGTVDDEAALKELARSIVPRVADMCVIVLRETGGTIRPLAIESEPASIISAMREISEKFPVPENSPFGLQHLLQTREPEIYLRMDEELLRKITQGDEHFQMLKALGLRSVIFYPLIAHDQLYGAILLATTEQTDKRFDEQDVAFAEEIARRASHAIYKARLLQEAQHEIERRSRLQGRLELLEDVSKLVSSSLVAGALLERIAPVLAPNFADWIAVDLIDERDDPERVLLYHSDATLRDVAAEYSKRFGSVATKALVDIMRTGEPVFVPTVDLSIHEQYGITSERSELLDQIGDCSFLLVPLHSRRRSLGAIGFHFGHSGRHYTEEDVEFAMEVATHVAAGIDNALLFTETERQMAELKSIYHSSPIGLALLDREGRYARVNEGLSSIHGISVEAHLGRTIEEVLGPIGTRLHHFLEEVIHNGTPIRDIEVSMVGRPGFVNGQNGASEKERTWIESYFPIFARPLDENGQATEGGHTPVVIGVSASTLDITDRKRFEQRLEEAKEVAEVASRTKDQFIATLSHELRTPLTPVLATAELLANDPDFPEAFRPFIDLIRRNIEIEARLIDDLLDMTRIAKGKLRMSQVDLDLHGLIPDVIDICRHELDKAELRVITRFDAEHSFVLGDRDRLSQVFWNLLHNATKFTPPGGVVTIQTRNEDRSPAIKGEYDVVIEVRDTGKGIERVDLARIFDPFEQERTPGPTLKDGLSGSLRGPGISATAAAAPISRANVQSGLGLGLAISRSIIEMHGGSIEAASDGLGKGSLFRIRLKATEVAPHAPKPRDLQPSAPSKGGRILFVDDHVDTNIALKVLLERRGYTVTTAATVARGLELALSDETFDLLVSDIGLPDGDGTDLLRAIRKERPLRAIAVSGYGTDADIEKSRKAGFEYHLKKPISFPDLERAIAEILNSEPA